jgi:hypothetical protein
MIQYLWEKKNKRLCVFWQLIIYKFLLIKLSSLHKQRRNKEYIENTYFMKIILIITVEIFLKLSRRLPKAVPIQIFIRFVFSLFSAFLESFFRRDKKIKYIGYMKMTGLLKCSTIVARNTQNLVSWNIVHCI